MALPGNVTNSTDVASSLLANEFQRPSNAPIASRCDPPKKVHSPALTRGGGCCSLSRFDKELFMTRSALLGKQCACDRRDRSKRWAAFSFVAALLLAGFCGASPARADAIGAGMQAYARQDYTRSAAVFLRRAELGEAVAQTYLGYMYANGRGVPQDFVAATKWLRCAADQGYPDAQFLLGLMYDKGHGVAQDFVEAEVWLNLAAAKSDRRQRDYWTRIRDAVAAKLTLDEVAEAQKRALEWTPVQER